MHVFDSNRLRGALPQSAVGGAESDILAELDRRDIDGAAVTPAWMLYGDARGSGEFESAANVEWTSPRLVRVPVVIPGTGGSGWPVNLSCLADVVIVRSCPTRHRFDPLGPSAMQWWHDLAEEAVPLVLDAGEVGLAGVAAIAKAVPELRVLVLQPGYRELVRLAELARDFPRLHFETGTIVGAGGIEWLARGIGAHRLVFGTGAPLWDDAGPRFQLEHLTLDDADVALIAGGSWQVLVGDRS